MGAKSYTPTRTARGARVSGTVASTLEEIAALATAAHKAKLRTMLKAMLMPKGRGESLLNCGTDSSEAAKSMDRVTLN